MAAAHPDIQDKYLMEGVKKEKVQTPWIASKVLAIRYHLGLAGAWNPLAQTALNLIQDNPALKVLEGLTRATLWGRDRADGFFYTKRCLKNG